MNIDQLEFNVGSLVRSVSGLGSTDAALISWYQAIYRQGSYSSPEAFAQRVKSSLDYVINAKKTDHALYKYASAGSAAARYNAMLSDVKRLWNSIRGTSSTTTAASTTSSTSTSSNRINSAPISSPVTISNTAVALSQPTGIMDKVKQYATPKNLALAAGAGALLYFLVIKK